MGDISKRIGQRIRRYRTDKNLSQAELAMLSGCHPTYIGQIERGEKNATIESVAKMAAALQVPLSTLFEKIDGDERQQSEVRNIPLECYELMSSKSRKEQELLMDLLLLMDQYRNL